MFSNNKVAILSLSGGMDSSTLLLHLLEKGYNVFALSFDYGQKHRLELERSQQLVKYITDSWSNVSKKGSKEFRHKIIKLDGLEQLLNSSLVSGGPEVPEGHYEQENMKETVVPNRNKIFSSILQAVALSKAKDPKQEVIIAMGLHAGDHQIYPDCRQEFRDADYEAFKIGNYDSELVSYYTPYLKVNKFEILQDGEKCCESLGLDFDEVYKKTNTSYKPIQVWNNIPKDGYQIHLTGLNANKYFKWFSDYKSAASVERIEAFIKLGRPDPVAYADETGAVSWEVAKSHVEKVLLEYAK